MINRERKFIVTMFIRCMKCEKSKKTIRELHILNCLKDCSQELRYRPYILEAFPQDGGLSMGCD